MCFENHRYISMLKWVNFFTFAHVWNWLVLYGHCPPPPSQTGKCGKKCSKPWHPDHEISVFWRLPVILNRWNIQFLKHLQMLIDLKILWEVLCYSEDLRLLQRETRCHGCPTEGSWRYFWTHKLLRRFFNFELWTGEWRLKESWCHCGGRTPTGEVPHLTCSSQHFEIYAVQAHSTRSTQIE